MPCSVNNSTVFWTSIESFPIRSSLVTTRVSPDPRRSQFLTRLCSRKADPPSAQLFVGERGAKAALRTQLGLCRQALPRQLGYLRL